MGDTETKKTSVKINGHTIRQLNEDNLNDWLVDIRAVLRSQKLWQYTQTPYKTTIVFKNPKAATSEEQVAYNEEQQAWIAKAEETANIMTSTISPNIKKKLNDTHFNNSYLMLQRIKEKLQSSYDAQFRKLTQEYDSVSGETLARAIVRARANIPPCKYCAKRHPGMCWKKHGDERLERRKMKEQYMRDKKSFEDAGRLQEFREDPVYQAIKSQFETLQKKISPSSLKNNPVWQATMRKVETLRKKMMDSRKSVKDAERNSIASDPRSSSG